MNKKTIIIMAGGTCGHIFPGLIIAHTLIKKGWNVSWLGTSNRIESKIIPKNKIPIQFININVTKKNFFSLIKLPFQMIRACYQAKLIIKQINPDVILGMGGYISLPGGLISFFCKIPLLIHEQNRVMGLSNTILSKLSTTVMQAFPETILHAKTVGNPLRQEIINLPNPISRFKGRTGPIRILVVGGTQGCRTFNSILPKVAYVLKNKIVVWHQIGKQNTYETLKYYKKFKLNPYKITSFIENIAEAYNWADMIICRSGAITVSEIQYIGLPAIFVPFPHKDKHQYWNAYPLTLLGGAIIVEQNFFNAKKIIKILEKINRKKIIVMSRKLYSRSNTNSVRDITNIIENTTHIY
ncbi:MAG: undecaprenyldiphospho-muramoylpentapeptide beta-N-acetylglucosaminyltransferase [Buchnera aphidicola (Meitanaphis elongallis)]